MTARIHDPSMRLVQELSWTFLLLEIEQEGERYVKRRKDLQQGNGVQEEVRV